MKLETRILVDEAGEVLATIQFPEGTPEARWEMSLCMHMPPAPVDEEPEEVPAKRAWWKFW